MLVLLTFVALPIFVSVFFLLYKYILNREVIEGIYLGDSQGNLTDAWMDTKELILAFFLDISKASSRYFNLAFHWLLHIFVLILGSVSDLFDYLYSNMRDLFLSTAIKEKEVMTKFWHHLKEYRREKDEI